MDDLEHQKSVTLLGLANFRRMPQVCRVHPLSGKSLRSVPSPLKNLIGLSFTTSSMRNIPNYIPPTPEDLHTSFALQHSIHSSNEDVSVSRIEEDSTVKSEITDVSGDMLLPTLSLTDFKSYIE